MYGCGTWCPAPVVLREFFIRVGARCSMVLFSEPSVRWAWTAPSLRARKWPANSRNGPIAILTSGRPVRFSGDISLVFIPESELFNYVQQGDTNFYAQSIRGAYQAFFDSNIQADFVALDDIGQYKIIYLPYPIMLKKETAAQASRVCRSGRHACFGRTARLFRRPCHVGTRQPNLGLDQLFGARERYVEFTPDLLEKLQLTVDGHQIFGRYFLQEYDATTGKAAGVYAKGHTAAVENQHGKGRTLLIGTYPGAGYYLHHSAEAKAFFAGLLKHAGVQPQLQTNNPAFQARLHSGPGGDILWITNPTRNPGSIEVSLQ